MDLNDHLFNKFRVVCGHQFGHVSIIRLQNGKEGRIITDASWRDDRPMVQITVPLGAIRHLDFQSLSRKPIDRFAVDEGHLYINVLVMGFKY